MARKLFLPFCTQGEALHWYANSLLKRGSIVLSKHVCKNQQCPSAEEVMNHEQKMVIILKRLQKCGRNLRVCFVYLKTHLFLTFLINESTLMKPTKKCIRASAAPFSR